MKRPLMFSVGILVFLVNVAPAPAQENQSSSVQREEMKKLSFLLGQWKGEGWMEFGPGQRSTFKQTEDVRSKLDGLLILIEGLGKSKLPDSDREMTVHNALAVVSYDEGAKLFRFRAYTARGQYTDSEGRIKDGVFEWGLRDPQRGNRVRFIIKLNEKGEWFEIGESSQDGQNWKKFFEMTLQRVK
jgi:hypothetical protein